MVRWCPDDKGRFHKRPFYKAEELDAECEKLLADFRRETGRKPDVAIDTDDLTVMIERHVGDLDVYADLSEDGPEVEGVTLFAAQRKPDVAIAERLTSDDRRSNRFRTTLAHELGHVVLHDPLYQEKLATGDLFAAVTEERLICKRDTMVDAPMTDWMEWQACYFSGALLMPRRAMIDLAKEHGDGITGAPRLGTDKAANLIAAAMDRFVVSQEAARVRLSVLGLLA
ncbi:ImmA/IrrE family metallo-endopeptidase [Devosia lacusdianchii]|uniref:ImmA/IrrE family metallo-endopeptidase n=1 Tax=Devosia lacusdianchii TaxID=2917991 RepID=UPI001F0605AD|nr:ImmA/IrrE family metallo-endopeptidase [Devosia sp. JXJ CY 41]